MNADTIENESGIFQSLRTRYTPGSFAFVALALLFVLYQFIGGGITVLLIGAEITKENAAMARTATMISQILFLLIPTLLLARRQHGALAEIFPMRLPGGKEFFLAVVGMFALMQTAEMYLFVQSKIPVPEQWLPYIDMIKRSIEEAFRVLISADSVPELLFVLLVAAVTPSLCEELMFRGLIQKNFSLEYGSRKGFLLAGTIFGVYHLNPFWLVPLIALGIYFSYLRHRSGSLVLPIVAHLINNGMATVGVYMYGAVDSTTPTMFMGAEAEPSLASVVGTGAVFGIIFYLVLVQYRKATEQNEGAN